MIAEPSYATRVQLCIRCPNGSNRTGACMVDGRQYHEHAVSGECPRGTYGVGVVELKTTLLTVSPSVLEERRAVCEGCPIGSFGGWAGPNIVRCREICRPCNTQGLISIAIHRCPRGHHEA